MPFNDEMEDDFKERELMQLLEDANHQGLSITAATRKFVTGVIGERNLAFYSKLMGTVDAAVRKGLRAGVTVDPASKESEGDLHIRMGYEMFASRHNGRYRRAAPKSPGV